MSTATEMLAAYIAAEAAVLQGQAITVAGRSLTRSNLAEIRHGRAEWQRAVTAEQVAAAGHSTSRFSQADFGGYT